MSRNRDAMKLLVGRIAEAALPGLVREIDEARHTTRAPRLKRAIAYARLRRAHASGNAEAVDRALAAYWKGGPGDKILDTYSDEHLTVFREQFAGVVDTLARSLEGSGHVFSRLVEIGCGDGRVLADCAMRFPAISDVVGLDINAAIIERASSREKTDGRLSFVHAEARDWLAAHPQPGTVMISYGGVLEYFSPDNLDRLFQTLASASPAAILLIEPAAPDHDLTHRPDSFIFGEEYTFSHNHRRRLAQAGFDVLLENETRAFNARMVTVIGVCGSAARQVCEERAAT